MQAGWLTVMVDDASGLAPLAERLAARGVVASMGATFVLVPGVADPAWQGLFSASGARVLACPIAERGVVLKQIIDAGRAQGAERFTFVHESAVPHLPADIETAVVACVIGVLPPRSLVQTVASRAGHPSALAFVAVARTVLDEIHYRLGPNDASFLFSLTLQARYAGVRVEEHVVGGVGPLGSVAALSLPALAAELVSFRLQRFGMLLQLKYRLVSNSKYADKTAMLYVSQRRAIDEVVKRMPPAARLLDLGCGPGHVARALEQHGFAVTAVDAGATPVPALRHFVRLDLDRDPLPDDVIRQDAVVMLDVIEHLSEPEEFLATLRQRWAHTVTGAPQLLFLSTPNVAFFQVRLNLLFGRFNYSDRGILDVTHRRLFTRASLRRALAWTGFDRIHEAPIGAPFETVIPGRLGRVAGRIGQTLADLAPTLFAFQFLVVARPLPPLLPSAHAPAGSADPHRNRPGPVV